MNDVTKFLDRTRKTSIEAAQLTRINASRLASWANAHRIPYMHTEDNPTNIKLHIYGRDRMLIANEGDWIIKHPETGYQVMNTKTFTTTYITHPQC